MVRAVFRMVLMQTKTRRPANPELKFYDPHNSHHNDSEYYRTQQAEDKPADKECYYGAYSHSCPVHGYCHFLSPHLLPSFPELCSCHPTPMLFRYPGVTGNSDTDTSTIKNQLHVPGGPVPEIPSNRGKFTRPLSRKIVDSHRGASPPFSNRKSVSIVYPGS